MAPSNIPSISPTTAPPQAKCGTTISFTVTGQPNAAFGFVNLAKTRYPFDIARITDNNGTTRIAKFTCAINGVVRTPKIIITNDGETERTDDFNFDQWELKAEEGEMIQIVIPLVDIMYDTQFSDEDAMEGKHKLLLKVWYFIQVY